jgi:hypothetical protein
MPTDDPGQTHYYGDGCADTHGRLTTLCARCGHDGAPPYDPDVEMEVCPPCDEHLRTLR